MNKFWERFFYLFAFIAQGSSFLSARAYAVIHRLHYAYNDEAERAKLPFVLNGLWNFMVKNKSIYADYKEFGIEPEKAFGDTYPEWPFIDGLSNMLFTRLLFAALYTAFYICFATHWWMFLLLPIHFFMAPILAELFILSDKKWMRFLFGTVLTYPLVKVLQVSDVITLQTPRPDDQCA